MMIPTGHRSNAMYADPAEPPDAGFEALYAAHFSHLTVQLYAYTGDLCAAQDVVQEAFCRALARWKRVSTYDDPVAWVRRVAWNLATSRWRRARTAVRHNLGQRPPTQPGPNPDRVALIQAMACLPAAQRRAVTLFYLADLPVCDIAAQEEVAEATVRSWLHRARNSLAATLSDEEYPHV
jgi:RNA polymerase sigma-70 factor (ECF subfamily)